MMLYAAIAGASLWILTEVLEMLAPAGHTPLSLWLTTLWHPILALGFWGLHKAQAPGKNTLSLVATIVVIAGLLLFAPVSLMFLYSGAASFDAFMQERPYLGGAGMLVALGIVLFAVSMIRCRYYPAWMAYGVIAAFLLVTIKNAAGLPEMIQHAGFIVISLIIIGMATIGLRRRRSTLIADAP